MKTRYAIYRRRTRRAGFLGLGVTTLLAPAGKLVAIALAAAIAGAAAHFAASHAGGKASMDEDKAPVQVAPSRPLPADTYTTESNGSLIDPENVRLPIATTGPGLSPDRPDGVDTMQSAGMDWKPHFALPAPAPENPPAPHLTSGAPISGTVRPHSGSRPPAGPPANPTPASPPPTGTNEPPGTILSSHSEPRSTADTPLVDADAPTGPSHPGVNNDSAFVPVSHKGVPTYEDAIPEEYSPPGPPDDPSADSPSPVLTASAPPAPSGALLPETMPDLTRTDASTGFDQNSVPEPSTMGLLAIGLFGLGWSRKRTAC